MFAVIAVETSRSNGTLTETASSEATPAAATCW